MINHHSDLRLPQNAEWILQGIIPDNGLVVIASAPKTGKSVFANAICRAMASGGEFAGVRWKAKVPVLWCSHEETKEERGPMLQGLTRDDPYYLAMAPNIISLDDPYCTDQMERRWTEPGDFMPYLYEQAERKGIQLMVIDCLHAAVRNSDLSQNNVARRIMAKLRYWSTKHGIATVVLHHLTKSAHRGYHPERFADSAQILAAASCHFFLESESLDDGTFKVVLHGAGRQPSPPMRQEFIATDLFTYHYAQESEKRRPETVAERVIGLLKEGWELTSVEIAQRLGLSLKSVQNVLTNLPDVETTAQRSRRNLYRWPSPPIPTPEGAREEDDSPTG